MITMNDQKTIAIQGCLASFHDMAVRKYFSNEEVQLLECVSFEKTCKELCMGNADLAMMAIEMVEIMRVVENHLQDSRVV